MHKYVPGEKWSDRRRHKVANDVARKVAHRFDQMMFPEGMDGGGEAVGASAGGASVPTDVPAPVVDPADQESIVDFPHDDLEEHFAPPAPILETKAPLEPPRSSPSNAPSPEAGTVLSGAIEGDNPHTSSLSTATRENTTPRIPAEKFPQWALVDESTSEAASSGKTVAEWAASFGPKKYQTDRHSSRQRVRGRIHLIVRGFLGDEWASERLAAQGVDAEDVQRFSSEIQKIAEEETASEEAHKAKMDGIKQAQIDRQAAEKELRKKSSKKGGVKGGEKGLGAAGGGGGPGVPGGETEGGKRGLINMSWAAPKGGKKEGKGGTTLWQDDIAWSRWGAGPGGGKANGVGKGFGGISDAGSQNFGWAMPWMAGGAIPLPMWGFPPSPTMMSTSPTGATGFFPMPMKGGGGGPPPPWGTPPPFPPAPLQFPPAQRGPTVAQSSSKRRRDDSSSSDSESSSSSAKKTEKTPPREPPSKAAPREDRNLPKRKSEESSRNFVLSPVAAGRTRLVVMW